MSYFVQNREEKQDAKEAINKLMLVHGLSWFQAELWLETGEYEENPEIAREALRSYQAGVWGEDEADWAHESSEGSARLLGEFRGVLDA